VGCKRQRVPIRGPGYRQRDARAIRAYARAVHLSLVAVVVDDYDPAIDFFTGVLGFELAQDEPALTNDGRPKRWVVVRPPGTATGLLLARADGEEQAAAVGHQAAGRVGWWSTALSWSRSRATSPTAGPWCSGTSRGTSGT
jgi:Glyoxalase/Bleomycin resistance protein/Dioxygenase superfamily